MNKKLQFFKNKLGSKWEDLEKVQLILLSGLPGSGKSFWGKLIAKELNSFYISSDAVRKEILKEYGERFTTKIEYQKISKVWYQELINRTKKKLNKGRNSVIDSTLLMKENREKIIRQLSKVLDNEKIIILLFKVDDKKVYKRLKGKFEKGKTKDLGKGCLRVRKDFNDLFKQGKASYPVSDNNIEVITINNNKPLPF